MGEEIEPLKTRLSELCGSYIVGARRSTGSIIQVYFDQNRGVSGEQSKGKNSILVEFSNWMITIRGTGYVDQDCSTGTIDRHLPKIVNMKVKSVQLDHGMNIDVVLDNGKIGISPLPDGLPDDQAWIFFRNCEDNMIVEAWTIMCNNDMSYWKGKSLRTAS